MKNAIDHVLAHLVTLIQRDELIDLSLAEERGDGLAMAREIRLDVRARIPHVNEPPRVYRAICIRRLAVEARRLRGTPDWRPSPLPLRVHARLTAFLLVA